MSDEDSSLVHSGGMPPHDPSEDARKQVETMSAMGIRQDDMANILDIDPKTLRKYYRRELDVGSTKATLKVAQSLFKQATEQNNVAAAIFWMKARANWSEKFDVSHAGEIMVSWKLSEHAS